MPPPSRSANQAEVSPGVWWLKFIGGIILWTIVLTGLHILGRMEDDGAYYFKFIGSWATRILYMGLLYLTLRESYMHFLLLMVLPLMILFGLFDITALAGHVSARTVFNVASAVVIALGYPIYLIYVVVRVIESRQFKMYFFAMILSAMAGGVYDIAIRPKSGEEAVTSSQVLREKLRDAMDQTNHSSRQDEYVPKL